MTVYDMIEECLKSALEWLSLDFKIELMLRWIDSIDDVYEDVINDEHLFNTLSRISKSLSSLFVLSKQIRDHKIDEYL